MAYVCGMPPQYAPAPVILTFDLLIIKVVSESRVMWANSVAILMFSRLSILDLGLMYATDRRQTASSLNPPPMGWGGGMIIIPTTDGDYAILTVCIFVCLFHWVVSK